MKKAIKKLILGIYLLFASLSTGRDKKDIEADMYNAKRRLGISFAEFIKGGMHRLSYKELQKLKKEETEPDLNVELVAELKGISYAKAKAEMDEIKERTGLLYKEYTAEKLYIYKTKKGLQKRLDRIAEKNEKYLREVCDDAGWSYEKAKEEADRAKRRYGLSYKKFSRYRFYSMTVEEQKAKMKHWTESSEKYVQTVMAESGWDRDRARRHINRYNVLYDILPPYYVMYRAWELSDEQMDSYARQKNSETIWARCNNPEETRILADKSLFDEVYKDYTGRRFWINRDTSFEEFAEFASGLKAVFCKPIESGGGLGTERHEVTDELHGLYELLMSRDRLLVEECIEQHPEIDEFIPGCVCTVRVVVLQDGEGIHTICTGMRFGHGGVTDNFSQDGMVADVDPESGIIRTDAIDKKGHVYETHPVSGKRFKGFQIPNWDMVRSVTENAMHVQGGVNYVGWDVAVCRDKAVLVEGNAMPDLVLIQAPYAPEKKGMKYLFEPYLKKEKQS